MTVLFIFPCAVGLIVLARPIYQLIYPNAPQGWELLQISAVGMIFIALNQTATGGLQGMGKVSAPAKALFWGILVKITLNFLLVRIPAVNIYGAPVASAACYLTSFVLEYRWLKQIIPIRRSFSRFVRRVILCAGGMGLAARLGYPVLHFLLPSNALALLTTIAGAAIFYFSLLLMAHESKLGEAI